MIVFKIIKLIIVLKFKLYYFSLFLGVMEKEHLNIVFIGYVDSGKSTVAGNLVHTLQKNDESEEDRNRKRTMQFLEEQAEQYGKPSCKFAFIFDKTTAERERGNSIETTFGELQTSKFHCSIIDTPGHYNFIRNTIRGISQSDVAILVVSGSPGEFEAGIAKENGQRLKHLLWHKVLESNN